MRYVTTDSGGITFVGNTLGLSKITQQNNPGALDSVGGFITLNTNSQLGTYPKGTTLNWSNNSSSAVLQMPTNATVLYAELIWSGTAQINTTNAPGSTGNVLEYLNTPVQFVQANGASNNITPDPLTASLVTNGTVTAPTAEFYVRSANVTTLVQAAGSGTYSVGGVPACVLAQEDANNACGWTLAVVYEDTLLHQRNLSLFVGNSFASTTATTPAPIGVVGFCSPPTGAINGYLFVSAIEGDPNKFGDEMLFGPNTNSLAVLSGPNNIKTNFFASQVNYADPDSSSNGLLNTTGTFGLSNSVPPVCGFSCRQGWDITCVNVSSGLTNGIESAYAQNITSGDGYSVNALALQIDVGSPVLTTTQTVNKASTFVGDTLTYTVVVTNSGTADGVNLIFTDPLPFGTSFIANTFATNGMTITGANPVNGVPVPDIPQGSSMTFTYQVTVDQIPPDAEFITHATINYQYSGPCAESPIINSSLVNLNVQTLVPLLNVNKVSSLSNVIPNATFTYTINIPNNGTTNTVDATLQDPLPVGVTYVTNTTTLNGVSIPDIDVTNMPYSVANEVNGPGDAAGVINAGQTAVVTFQVKIDASPPTRINNSATIFASGIEPTTAANAQNNISPVYCDLAAGISASPNPVQAGGPVTFTITVTNFGTNSLNLVTNFVDLYLPIPSSIESPVYTPGTGAYDPLTGVWSGITLPSNGVVTMTISGTLSPSTTSTNLIGSVTVTPPSGIIDLDLTNNSASSTNEVVQMADLAASISDGLTNVYEGSSITNIITIVNLGPSTVNSLTLSNFISSSLGNVTVFAADGIFNQAAGTWTALSIGAGDSVQITEVGTVLTVSGPFTNSVIVYPPSGVTDPNFSNNSASNVNNALPLPNTAVTKTGPATVDADTNFIYTITITNAGPGTASNVVASDTLPTGTSFVNASGGGVNTSGTVNWTIGTVAPNGSSNVTVTVTAPVTAVSLTNTASITASTPTANPASDTSPQVVTTVTPVADVGIGKTGPLGVVVTSNFTYTVSVTNFGPSVASGVVATDTLPTQVTYVSSSGGGVRVGRTVGWALGSLNVGQITNVTVTVTAPAAAGSITNVATTTATTLDTNLVNNTSPNVITTVSILANSADIKVIKTGVSSVFATSNLIYTITVTNIGPAAAANVTASDTLPTNVNYVTSSGTLTAGTVNWTIGALAPHGTTNLMLTVTAPGNGTITNIASASSTTADPDLTNNISAPVGTTVTPAADLAIGKNGAGTIFATSNLTYTISVTNFGPSTASSVIVTDTLPQGTIFVNAGASGTTNAGVASWSLGSLTSGASTNFTLVVTAPASGTLTNTASVTSPTADPVPGNNVSPPVTTTVTPLADLAVGKSGAGTIFATSNLTYTITLTNFGPSTASSVVVTDALPAGVTFVSALGGATNSGVVTWNLASLAANATTNFALVVTAPASGTLTNTASVTSPTTDPVPGNNISPPVTTMVTPLADLAVGKSGAPSIVATSNLVYTITVTNFGPSTAGSIVVTDALPAGVMFVSAPGGANSLGVVTWNLASLAANATTNFILTVTAPVSGNLTNIASITSPTTDPVPGNNVSPPVITTVTPLADLAVGKSGAPSIVATSNLVYTITVTNFGPSTASGVIVTDTLPQETIFVSAGANGTTNSGVASWSLGALASGASTNFTLVVTAPASGTLTNTASVTSPTSDPVLTNNVSPSVVTTVTPLADLAIGKSGAPSIVATSNLVYTITVTNFGPSTASSVVVTDALPAGVTFVSAGASGNTNAGVASWSLGSLASGATTNFTLVVIAPASGNLTNTASVTSPTTDPVPGNNVSPPVVTTLTPLADLAVGKSGAPTIVATSNLTYTISVTNFGPSTASSVIVTDTLPQGTIFVSAGASGTTNAGVVSWSLGALASGATTNFTLVVTAPASGTLTNTASVTSPTSDPVLTNNVSLPVTTTVTALADLAVGKSAAASVFAASNLSYTISVTNFGPSTASSIVVTDALPAGVTFVSAPGGANSSGVVTWNLASLAANATTNYTLVVTAPASGTLTNTASVTSPTPDPILTNNVSPPVTTTVTPLADLAVGKSAAATVFAVSNLTYIVTVTNFGPSTASSIVVTDALPTGVTFVSAPGGVTNSGVVTWSLATLAANATTNFTLTVTAPVSGSLTNTASVTSPTPDPNLTNNVTPPVVTTVTPLADVAAIKTGPAGAAVGGTLVYTITITNFGPSTATGVVATDSLPSGFTYVTASGNGVNNSGLVTWNLGSLGAAAGTNVTVTVTASVDGVFTNIAEAGSSVIDPDPTNNNGASTNSQVVTSVSPVADLGINKLGPPNVFAATNFSYTIVVTNGGPSVASNTVVSDVLPTNVLYFGASSSGADVAGTVTWSLGNLASNAVTNLTVTVTAPAGGVISNTATVNSTTLDTNLLNNTSPPVITTVTPVADLAVGKSAAPTVFAASNLIYTVTVTNFGPSTASSIVVTDALPMGVTFVSAPGGATNSGVVTWNLASLAANATTNFTLTVTAPASGSLTNTASVTSPTPDPNLTNNVTPPVVTTVTPVADLAVGKSAAASVFAASNLIYTVTVTNLGPSTASSVVVTDALPAGVTFVSVPGGAINSGVVTWSLATLAANAMTNFALTVTAPASGTLTNTASVTSPTPDPNLTNNVTPPVVTTVTPLADLAVGKSGPIGVLFNTNFNYQISVTNFGPSTGMSISVTDSLPVGLAFVSATPTAAATGNLVVWTNIGDLAAGATTNLTLTVISTQRGSITNLALVGTPTLDPTPSNNVSPPVITVVTNDPPLTNPQTNFITENTTNIFSPLTNDVVETPGGTLTIISVSPINGTAMILGGTNVVFVPATNFLGTTTIGYTITDGVGGTNSSLITVIVTNIPPLANPDTYGITENTSSTLTPLNDDVLETPGGTLSIISVAPTNGTASIIGGTNVLFTPTTNFLGTATIGYTITDGIGGTNRSLITIAVTNIPPLANPDIYLTPENTSSTTSPLTNDVVQTPGGTLRIISVTPTNGTASIIGGTNVLFTPITNFLGTATIGYTITDGIGGTDSSLITVIVTNRLPLANPLTNSITENTTNAFSPLTNDIVETPGGTLTIIAVSPTNGTATIVGGTNVVFVPATNFLGTTTIGYTITDGVGGTNSSLITVIVTNIPPIANPDNYSIPENATNTLTPLANDVLETPGGTLTIIAVSPTNGTATIVGGTNVTFIPTTDFIGTATIGYTITDNIGGTNSSLITITVTNRPPLTNPLTNSITENTTNTFSPLTNDVVETPGGILTIIAVSPTNGTATILGGTNVVFVPATNFLGTTTIGYTITDGVGGTNSSLITVIVTNIPPIANPDTYSITENTGTTLLPLNNDIVETPGGTLSIIAVSPTNGTATIFGGTNVLFTPATNFLGTATIGYTITDGIGGTNRSLITITITNIPPLANPDVYSMPENTSSTTSPLTNDVVETPGGMLHIISLAPTNGAASIIGGTNVLFTPTTNFLGTATIGYTITDGIGGTNSSLITITVTNRPPLANPDTYSVTENTTNTLTPLSNDVLETPGGTLTIIAVSPTNGTATILGGTNVLFTPTTNFLGTATIGYTITDGIGGTNSSLITVTVTNRPPLANPDSYSVAENSTNTLTPLANDVLETPGGTLTIVAASPTNGAATIIGGTNVTFIPTTDFIGTATIGYTITDSIGGTNSSLITVTVTNRPPTANPQSLATPANTPLMITLTGSDPQSLPLTFAIVNSSTNGTLSNLNTNTGTVTYTPNTNYFGPDSFTFRVNDGQTNSATATVTLTVAAAADVAVLKFGPAAGAASSNLVYTIVVTNSGPATATNVLVADQLPSAFTLVSAVPSGSISNNLVTWPSFNLTNRGSSTFVVTAISATDGTYTNVAFSTATTMDPNPTNNNGSATNSQVVTAVTPAADVAIFNNGPSVAVPGATITYTITATNMGPTTASNVVVQDTLPATAAFVSATSGITPVGNTLTWPSMNMTPGAVVVFTVTVIAPANGTIVDIASSTASSFDPNLANNNGTAAASQVTTLVTPVADIQVYLFGPTNVTVGDGFSYTVEVTNAGPSTASNILARDTLPTNVVFTSASTAGTFSNGIVTWPVFTTLTNGQATNLTVQVVPSAFDSSNIFSYPSGNDSYNFVETNTAYIFGFLTNIASAFASTFDPNLTNNNGTLPTAQVETVIVPGVFNIFVATNTYPTNVPSTNTVTPIGPDLYAVGTGAFNPQTGLFEESVSVTNIGTTTVHSLRLYIGGLRSGVTVYNATGTNNGVPYVEYDSPYSTPLLPAPSPDDNVTFVVEFNDVNRQPFTDTLTVVAIPAPTVVPPPGTPISSTILEVPDNRVPGDVRFLVQFNSIPGRTYTIEYGPDVNSITNVAVPSIVAAANVTQWYDDGPPETVSKPSSVASRFYQVILNP